MGTENNRISKCLWGKIIGGERVINVYFNHWFSAIYNTIKSIRDIPDVRVIASSKNKDSVYKNIVDEFIIEPEKREGYAKWVLDICIEYKVDILFVKRGMLEISACRSEFEKIGTKLVCDDAIIINSINSKSETYKLLQGIASIPPYEVVTDSISLQAHIISYLNKYNSCIVKYDEDEGANSFRVISNEVSLNTLELGPPINKVSPESIINSYKLEELKGNAKKTLVMPYLRGPEVSVDCYLASKGDIAIPRFKESGRVQRIIKDRYLIDMSIAIGRRLNLRCPYNVQFRYMGGKPVLLEVNTRISGGLQLTTCCGIDIARVCLYDLLNIEYKIPEFREVAVSQVETPVILEEIHNA